MLSATTASWASTPNDADSRKLSNDVIADATNGVPLNVVNSIEVRKPSATTDSVMSCFVTSNTSFCASGDSGRLDFMARNVQMSGTQGDFDSGSRRFRTLRRIRDVRQAFETP